MANNQPEPLYWISTKSGKHIPIFDKDPQKNAQILKARREAYKLNHSDKITPKEPDAHVEPFIRMKTHLASKGINSEEEIANYLSGLSATRRSKLAREMGLESRGQNKIREMAHRIFNADKNPNPNPAPVPVSKPEPPKPEPPKTEPPKTTPVTSNKSNVSRMQPYPEYKSSIGEKHDINVADQLEKCQKENLINPHFKDITDRKDKNYYKYHKNCALCSVAATLQARGYDVEAMPRDKDHWRGFETVFEYDYTNPDNFLMGGAKNSWDNFEVTRILRRKINNGVLQSGDYERMPRGARQAAAAIIARSQKWGEGSIGELSVDWKGTVSTHSVLIVNTRGKTYLWCPQSNRIVSGQAEIAHYLSRTIASHTQLVRVDNARFKPGIGAELEKMVRVRDTSVSAQLAAGLNGVDWDKF